MITSEQFRDFQRCPVFNDPCVVHMQCGHWIPNEGGIEVYVPQLRRFHTTRRVSGADMFVATTGNLPNGITYWNDGIDLGQCICPMCHPVRSK